MCPNPLFLLFSLVDGFFLGAVFEDEGDLQVDLVALDVTVLYEDIHVLDPATLHVAQRLVSTVYGFLDGLLKALWVDGAQLRYACNSHTLYGHLLLRVSSLAPLL